MHNSAYKLLAHIYWLAVQFLAETIPSWQGCGHHGTTSHAASVQRNCCKPQPQIWGLHQQRTTVSTVGCHITQIWNFYFVNRVIRVLTSYLQNLFYFYFRFGGGGVLARQPPYFGAPLTAPQLQKFLAGWEISGMCCTAIASSVESQSLSHVLNLFEKIMPARKHYISKWVGMRSGDCGGRRTHWPR
jgi:hypothetical protein